jgi:hypothetical protein
MRAVSLSEPIVEEAEVPGALKQWKSKSTSRKGKAAEMVLAGRDRM